MQIDTLEKLCVEELKDLYNAEKQILKALPKMIKAATHPELKDAFKKHLAQTEVHVERLEAVFQAAEARLERRQLTAQPAAGLRRPAPIDHRPSQLRFLEDHVRLQRGDLLAHLLPSRVVHQPLIRVGRRVVLDQLLDPIVRR